MGTEKISVKQLERMLLDIDVPEAELRPFIVESAEESTPLNPVVKVNPARVEINYLEGAIALGSLNGVSRWRRQQRYRSKIQGWTEMRIVSEGDSWFQYPFLLDDVIDQLFDHHAIYSLDAAGDLISDMVRQNELVSAVVQEQPQVVLLSGGGNDVLGGARLSTMLPSYHPERAPEDYLGAAFEANLGRVLADYETLISRMFAIKPDTRVVCHSYDHAIPANGRWLGQPLARIGIVDPGLQRDIVWRIVDRFHSGLSAIAARYPGVRLVDCRGKVQSNRWHDELHPDNAGFKAVAALFAAAIAGETDAPLSATEAAMRPGAIEATAPALSLSDQAQALLSTYSEPILLREIGRRKALADARDPAAGDALLVYRTSIEEDFPEQLALGSRLADDAARVASSALGVPGAPGRAMAQDWPGESRAMATQVAASLSGYAGLPAAGTAMLAAVVAARLARPPDPPGGAGSQPPA